MSGEQRTRILEAMDTDDADVVRQLLTYEAGTAGGMMTPELIMLGPTATVADALAQIRDPDWVVVDRRPGVRVPAAVQGPDRSPARDGPRAAPAARGPRASSCAIASARIRRVRPDATDRAVAELLARYDMLAVAVCDEQGHLLGAVTVDDVLDRSSARRGASATATPTRCDRAAGRGRGRRRGEAPRRPQRAACLAADRARLRPRCVRQLRRVDRPLPRHRPVPRVPDRDRGDLDRPATSFARPAAVGPVLRLHPAEPGVLDSRLRTPPR